MIGGGKPEKSGSREKDDFYATNPKAIFAASKMFEEIGLCGRVWECACGTGNISNSLIQLGYNVKSSDKVDRGYGKQIDFLSYSRINMDCDIITNPPFKYASEFINKSMQILKQGRKACFFLKIQFLEGKERKKMFKKINPKFVYVYSKRQSCSKNNQPEIYGWGNTFCYCWIIFEKGYVGETILRWI